VPISSGVREARLRDMVAHQRELLILASDADLDLFDRVAARKAKNILYMNWNDDVRTGYFDVASSAASARSPMTPAASIMACSCP